MRFVDTSFWVALTFARDHWHQTARALFQDHSQSLVTTNLVVGETWTYLRRRTDHAIALKFVKSVQSSSRVRIHRVELETEMEAWEWLTRHDERVYSFVDSTSFAVMRRQRIGEALAFDGDFSAASFVEVRTVG